MKEKEKKEQGEREIRKGKSGRKEMEKRKL
jgi:hypothetical protein